VYEQSSNEHEIKNMIFELAAVEIGQHFYWNLSGFQVHGQVLINTWIVISILLISYPRPNPVIESGAKYGRTCCMGASSALHFTTVGGHTERGH
jgi:hypothetical protein